MSFKSDSVPYIHPNSEKASEFGLAPDFHVLVRKQGQIRAGSDGLKYPLMSAVVVFSASPIGKKGRNRGGNYVWANHVSAVVKK